MTTLFQQVHSTPLAIFGCIPKIEKKLNQNSKKKCNGYFSIVEMIILKNKTKSGTHQRLTFVFISTTNLTILKC